MDIQSDDAKNKEVFLYKKGFNCDYFALVIQGRVEVTVGSENILFEDGPFSVFGVGALTREAGSPAFSPDYTVKLLTNIQLLKISRSLYRSAIRATRLERQNKTPEIYQEYDEIFFEEAKRNKNSPLPPPDALSANSYDSDRSCTPTKQGNNTKRRMDSLLRRLTPKYDRRKDSKDKEEVKTLSVGSGQENPLIANVEETDAQLGVIAIEQNGSLDRTTTDSPV